MMRLVFTVLCVLLLSPLTALLAPTAWAQTSGSAPSAQPAISADQARTALDVLNDPNKRAAVAATLNALINTQPATAVPATAPAGAAVPGATEPARPGSARTTVEGLSIPLAPDSLGAQVLLSAADFVHNVGNETIDALDTVQSLPLLYGWAVVMVTNPIAQNLLADVGWRIAVVLTCAAAVEYGLRRLMQRPIHALGDLAPAVRLADANDPSPDPRPDENAKAAAIGRAEAGDTEAVVAAKHPRLSTWTLLGRVPLVLARLLLELVRVAGIVVIGHLIAGSSVGGQTVSRLIILAVVDSYALCITCICIARMLLSPDESSLRLFHLRDATAAYMMRWTRRLILIAVLGYAVGEVGLLLGLSDMGHDALQKTVGLVLHICLAFIVIKNRRTVRHWLRAPDGSTGLLATVRNGLAAGWHWIALFFLISGWLVWAVEVPHGFAVVLHYFIVTSLLMIGARLSLLLLVGSVDRIMRPNPNKTVPYHGIRARLGVYHPAVSAAVRLTIYLLSILGLLQLYGLNTFLWLVESALGQRILSASGTLLTTIVLAFGIWEAVNGGVQQHLDRLQRNAQLAKTARLRTLLPLLRTTLMITIAIVAGLMILSEIGINIAPLLAGAGIVGVAIGFGSQKLVQDLITGIFLLLENAMQVGDTVTVSGLSGVVEALSVRTIRLRAGDGSVHIIPFSAVTSVTNVNRGLGNAAISVSIAYDEDTDRAANELTAIVESMRSDPDLSAKMLSDFQLWGVDKVDGSSSTIVGQVVCTDSGRWAVQREFNRRMKRRFQELGIRIFNPVQTITLVQPPMEKGNDHGHAAAAD